MLATALERIRVETLDLVGPDLTRLCYQRDPVRVLISSGAHHISVCRFVARGPLLVFNSQKDGPVVVPYNWWMTLRQERSFSATAMELIIPEGRPEGPYTRTSRPAVENEDLFHLTNFRPDPMYFARFEVRIDDTKRFI